MTTITLWLLVSVSYGSNNSGNLTVVERFREVVAPLMQEHKKLAGRSWSPPTRMLNNLRGHLANAIMVGMKNETPTTPLLGLLRALETDERRQEFAALCSTSVLYLYQLAGCHRVSCRAQKALAIAQASEQMALTYGTPTIDMQTLATMCAEGGCSA